MFEQNISDKLDIIELSQVLTEMCVTLIQARVSIENLRLG